MDLAELERQVEYKVAPGPLVAVQALANTYDFESDEERLLDPQSAHSWLIESDLIEPGVRVGRTEWKRLCEFRKVLRELIEANLSGAPTDTATADLARLARAHPVPLVAGEGTGLDLDLAPAGSVKTLISQMIGLIFAAQLEGRWERLKICASDECRWAFYDSSRNRGGTWCQMEVCGNRIKNRAYRRRHAAN
jgi:predicted RNA-binding Zn ribbon-like protein